MKPFAFFAWMMAGLLAASGVLAQPKKTVAKAAAKSVSGIWRGYFVTESGEQYKLEFQVDQNSKIVRGVSYSYLDTRFYGKSSMTGAFFANDDKFRIEELRTVEVRNLGGGGTCLMNYNLTFSQSGNEMFLEGTYLGKREDRKNPKNNGTWGDCGGGRVYLRRVETSDFPLEAFLKNKNVTPRADTIARVSKPIPKTTPPVAKRVTTPAKTGTAAQKPVVKATPKPRPEKPAPSVVRNNTVQKDPEVKPVEVAKRPEPRPAVIPQQTRNRENATARVIDVRNEEILIKLYDNGEIDDDTISVYLDDKLVLASKRLSASPIELKVKLDADHPEHVVVMVAENMGRIPPNTSLMIVWDGEKRYEVQITSTEQRNAMVRFRYRKGTDTAGTE
jgi:hypothetical protein